MISLSAAILVATCTATFGLHSSSSTTSSYSYLAFASALRSRTARSAELRPPMPLTETPPVSGPMKPTFTLSLAVATPAVTASAAAATSAMMLCFRWMRTRPLIFGCGNLRRGSSANETASVGHAEVRRERTGEVKQRFVAAEPPHERQPDRAAGHRAG